jgi:hypothetical protein
MLLMQMTSQEQNIHYLYLIYIDFLTVLKD